VDDPLLLLRAVDWVAERLAARPAAAMVAALVLEPAG
jgi:hypothetical protein